MRAVRALVWHGPRRMSVDDVPDVAPGPGTFVLVPPGVRHGFSNHADMPVRMLNLHAPAGFDLRIAGD